MAKLLPLQKYEAMDYNGLVTDNHFHALYMQKRCCKDNMTKTFL
jgi:hypothetical protein